MDNFALILEHAWDYSAIDVTNIVGATSCWYDMYRAKTMEYLGNRRALPDIMRMLDAGRDFGADAVPTTYIENHDHKAFALKASGDRGEWWRMQPYMIALFTCAGAVLVHNGQEFANSYDMPEEGDGRVKPRPIPWETIKDQNGNSVASLLQKLIALRATHPALKTSNFYPRNWDETWQMRDKDGLGLDVNEQVLVYHRWGNNASHASKVDRYYVVLNFSDDLNHRYVTFNVAHSGQWKDLLTGETFDTAGSSFTLTVQVGRCWGRVLYQST